MGFLNRIGRLIKGVVSLFITGLEESNPEVLLEAAKQDFHEKLVQYNNALAKLGGIAERLKSQIRNKNEKVKILTQRILTNNSAGNLELAGSLAREAQEMKQDLEHDTAELKDTEQAYEANVLNAKLARKDFEEKITRLERQLSQVKVKEAQADAAAALNGVAFKVGDVGDTLKDAENILQKKYEQAAGKARVANDMNDFDKVKEKESERKALEQAALADFLAGNNIKLETPEASPEKPISQKEIGPKVG